jgi:hypothetical protein
MPLLYAIPHALQSMISSGQAQLIGAVIKDVSSGQILGHVQQTQGLTQALMQAGGAVAQTGFSPLGAISAIQNEQIKSSLTQLGEGMSLLQNLQFASMALSGIGIGVSVAGFVMMNIRLNAIEAHIGTLRDEIGEVGKLIQRVEIRRLFSNIRSALNDLDNVATRTDHLALASALQRELSKHVSALSDLVLEAMNPGKATALPLQQLDLVWTLSSAKWLCEEAEIRALFVSEDLSHAGNYAARYRKDNLGCLNQLNPDALARLIAADATDLPASIALRRKATAHLTRIAEGFARAVNSLDQQQSISAALIVADVSGRAFIQAASAETESPYLIITPKP